MTSPEHGTSIDKPIREMLLDPVVQLLLKNSNVTRIQFETLMVDYLWRQLADQIESVRGKRELRPGKRRISRGSFNRTLIQARTNVIRSIYTVFLLGYVKMFDSPKLEPFLEVADQIRTFAESRSDQSEAASRETLALLARSLEVTLTELASGRSFLEKL